jgi:putative restriction endonuclease
MPALRSTELTQAILKALAESSVNAVLVSDPGRNPRRIKVYTSQERVDLWVYIWTLTHGGGAARPASEYRVQLTGVSSPLQENPAGITLLLGYEPSLECFAGFDVERHKRFSSNSPSIQVPITALHQAQAEGLSFARKNNDEVAIGFRADLFLTYLLNAHSLHRYAGDATTAGLLRNNLTLVTPTATQLGRISAERKRVVLTVARLWRASNFRRQVLSAYDQRCAVTGMQLKLNDAAHILPVGAEGSTDEISNGLCLSPTYHRAFDRALIYLDEDLITRVNPRQERELRNSGLAGGIDEISRHINRRIQLPAYAANWPNIALIREANRHRGINT